MTTNDLIKLARFNVEYFHDDHDLAVYIAFLFQHLADLSEDWAQALEDDFVELELDK